MIDVEQYECHNRFGNNNGVVDTKNKGKGIQFDPFSFSNVVGSHPPGSYDHNPFSQYANEVMDVDDYPMFQGGFGSKNMASDVEVVWGSSPNSNGTAKSSRSSLRNQVTKANGNSFVATPHVTQSWDFFSGSALPQNNQAMYSSTTFSASVVQPQIPDIVMVPTPFSNNYDASASSSRPMVAEVTSSAQDSSNVRKIKEEFLRNFKRFDTVEDYSDHHYASKGNASKQVMIKLSSPGGCCLNRSFIFNILYL